MRQLARFLSFVAATMALDLVSGLIGRAVAGSTGLNFGMRMTDRLCFAFVAASVAVYGWQFLTAPFNDWNDDRTAGKPE